VNKMKISQGDTLDVGAVALHLTEGHDNKNRAKKRRGDKQKYISKI